MRSDPCVREIETSKLRPALASQAERASKIITVDEKGKADVCVNHIASPENSETSRSSKQRSADSR